MPVGLLYTGHALDILKSIAPESIQMCMTSPPYWGLRDYGLCSCRQGRVQHESSTLVGSQAGTPSEFSDPDPACLKCLGTGHLNSTNHIWGGTQDCQHQWTQGSSIDIPTGGTGVSSVKQVTNRGTQHDRVIMPSDTGSKQATNKGSRFSGSTCSTCSAWFGSLGLEPTPEMFIEHLVAIFREVRRVLRNDGTLWVNIGDSYARMQEGNVAQSKNKVVQPPVMSGRIKNAGMKAKDLVGIPWMLAFALRTDGWYLRQDIIWHKKKSDARVCDRSLCQRT